MTIRLRRVCKVSMAAEEGVAEIDLALAIGKGGTTPITQSWEIVAAGVKTVKVDVVRTTMIATATIATARAVVGVVIVIVSVIVIEEAVATVVETTGTGTVSETETGTMVTPTNAAGTRRLTLNEARVKL